MPQTCVRLPPRFGRDCVPSRQVFLSFLNKFTVVQGAQVTIGASDAMHKLQLASALIEPAVTEDQRYVASYNGHQVKSLVLSYLFLCNQNSCFPASERGAAPESAGLFSPSTAAANAAHLVFYHKNQQYNRLVCISF